MSLNKNIGGANLSNGLQMIPASNGPDLFDINTSDAGLKEGTLRFATRDPATFGPARATPCPEFTTEDARTQAELDRLPFMGAHTSKIIWNGGGIGIHYLDVLCQGAIFNQGEAVESVLEVLLTDRGSGYTIAPDVVFTSTDEVTPAVAYARLRRGGGDIAAPGSGYVVGDILTFIGGTYDVVHKERVTVVDGSGGVQETVIAQRSEYSIVPSNPISFSGGTGTGAQFAVTNWEVGIVRVTDTGDYKGTIPPVVTLPLVAGETPATAVASMGPPHYTDTLLFTVPFDPVTTVKDTVEFTIYGAAAVPAAIQARLTTPSLPEYLHASPYFGEDVIYSLAAVALPPIDGRAVNIGDRILLTDGTEFAGLYRVTQLGGLYNGSFYSWFMAREPEMDASVEVSTAIYVQITDGDLNAGNTFHCTVSGAFTIDVDPITFELTVAPPAYVPLYRVTIDYRAIELNFDYIAGVKQPDPRFVRDEYQLDANRRIIINPATGEVFGLKLDEVTAIKLNVTVDATSGNITVTDGPQVALAEGIWRPWVKYIGTAAQFQQVPAGQYWHVTETATVKMVPIQATGSIVGP
jgi:hypothetical protein